MIGVRRILEIGTPGGHSAIWLARAVSPGGPIVTLDADLHHAAVAQASFDDAGLAERIRLRVGPAMETLPRLLDESAGPFDPVFIGADRPSDPEHRAWALRLSRPGTVIVGDDVERDGAVADPAATDPRVVGVQRFRPDRRRTEARGDRDPDRRRRGQGRFALALVVS